MRKPLDNLFTFYRGPSHRDDEQYHPGKQLEDNATKSLLNVLEETATRDEIVLEQVLKGIEHSVGKTSITDPESNGWEINTQEPLNAVGNKERTYLIGLSKSGDDPLGVESIDDGTPPDNESRRRLDAVITHDTAGVTVVIESKFNFNDLNLDQLQSYAAALGVNGSRYATISWRDIYQWLGESSNEITPTSEYLVEEFRTYLEYWVLEFELSSSRWTGGTNQVKLVRNERPLRESSEIDAKEPEVVLQFRTLPSDPDKNRGPRVQFTESEWQALIQDLKESGERMGYDFLNAFRETSDRDTFWKPVKDAYEDEGAHTIIASIGEQGSVRKVLRIDDDSDEDSSNDEIKPLLTFQTWSEGNSALRGSRPMFDGDEFYSLFYNSQKEDSGLTDHQRRALFSSEVSFEELFR
jgi:hypothetical protein